MDKSTLTVIGVWLAVAVLAANAWFTFQVVTELQSEPTDPLQVAVVEVTSEQPIDVDIAEVSNGGDFWETGYLPTSPALFRTDEGELDMIDRRVRVQNTVDVRGDVTVDNGFPNAVPVDVVSLP